MKIQINGDPRELSEGGTVDEVLSRLGIPLQATLVEHNGTALHRKEWSERVVNDGDVLEVIRIVAGG
jgi:sulfur carrier protein